MSNQLCSAFLRTARRRRLRACLTRECHRILPSFIERSASVRWRRHGVFLSEALAFCAMCEAVGVDVILESGIKCGVSTELLARYFGERSSILAIDRAQGPVIKDTMERLSACSNLSFVFGDSRDVLPAVLRNSAGARVGVLIDGPKGMTALRLARRCFDASESVRFVAVHDLGRSAVRRASPGIGRAADFLAATRMVQCSPTSLGFSAVLVTSIEHTRRSTPIFTISYGSTPTGADWRFGLGGSLMSLFPRRVQKGRYLLIHQRIRIGYRSDESVNVSVVVVSGERLVVQHRTHLMLPNMARHNCYHAIHVDSRFQAEGRYQIKAEALVGGNRLESTTRHSDYFDVVEAEGEAVPGADAYDLQVSSRELVAAYIAAMEHADLRAVLSPRDDARATGSLEEGCLEDATTFERLVNGDGDQRSASTAVGRELVSRASPSMLLRAAFRSRDLPRVLSALYGT